MINAFALSIAMLMSSSLTLEDYLYRAIERG